MKKIIPVFLSEMCWERGYHVTKEKVRVELEEGGAFFALAHV